MRKRLEFSWGFNESNPPPPMFKRRQQPFEPPLMFKRRQEPIEEVTGGKKS